MTVPVPSTVLAGLGERLARATGPDNALDIEIEIALFKPDRRHASVRPNAAGTKLVYQRHDGRTDTHWAADYTLNEASRKRALAALSRSLPTIPEEASK